MNKTHRHIICACNLKYIVYVHVTWSIKNTKRPGEVCSWCTLLELRARRRKRRTARDWVAFFKIARRCNDVTCRKAVLPMARTLRQLHRTQNKEKHKKTLYWFWPFEYVTERQKYSWCPARILLMFTSFETKVFFKIARRCNDVTCRKVVLPMARTLGKLLRTQTKRNIQRHFVYFDRLSMLLPKILVVSNQNASYLYAYWNKSIPQDRPAL